MRIGKRITVLLLLFLLGCSGSTPSGTTDTSVTDTSKDVTTAIDQTTPTDTALTDLTTTKDVASQIDASAPKDKTSPDTTAGDLITPQPDASSGLIQPTTCFELPTDPNAILPLDGTFTANSPLWRRPNDEFEECPAAELLPETAALVPYVAYAVCNKDSKPHKYTFELLAYEGPNKEHPLDDPYLVLYQGQTIPDNLLNCLAVNDDIPETLQTTDAEIAEVLIPAGGAVTMVATSVTFDPQDGTGTGYFVLVVSLSQ